MSILTMADAARMFGFTGTGASLRAKRHLKRRERETSSVILTRSHGPKGQTTHTVTLAALKDHYPELFSRVDKIAGAIRDELSDVYERIADVEARAGARLTHLERHDVDSRRRLLKVENKTDQNRAGTL